MAAYQPRQATHAQASSSGRAAVCLPAQGRCWRRAGRRHLLVHARAVTSPKVVYMQTFLEQSDFAAVLKDAERLRPQLREELNCVAVGRTGCYVPANSDTAAIFGRRDVTAKISKRVRSPFPLFLSDFPIELRAYPHGAEMPWHVDEQMFATPQWEVIFTVDNDSDSTTEWREPGGRSHSVWTAPNSLLCVQAEGWEHRVLPVNKGVRTILKIAYTSCKTKLPAFDVNLNREAYSE